MSDVLTPDDIDPKFSSLVSAFTGKQGERGPPGLQGPPGRDGATGSSSSGGGLVYPDLPPVVANAMDDEFAAGTLDAKWVARNFSTTTTTFPITSWLKITPPASASDNIRILTQAIPAAQNYEVVLKCSLDGTETNFSAGGLILDNGTGFYVLGFEYISGSFRVQTWTNVTSIAAQPGISENSTVTHVWFKISYTLSSNTFKFYWSTNGVGYHRLASFVDALTITRVGIYCNETNNSGATALYCDYFRRTA